MAEIPFVAMILQADWVVRSILILLAIESVLAWGVIGDRLVNLGGLRKLNRRFRVLFDKAGSLTDVENVDKKFEKSHFASMGSVGVQEYRRILGDAQAGGAAAARDPSFFLQSQFDSAGDRLESATSELCGRLGRGTYLLAIIGTSAPFLGLLGTVWGIMDSFFEIGRQGSASLPVVAPGIAEALITTVVGLLVAIPASFFYSYILHKTHRLEDELDEFRERVLARIRREVLSLVLGGKTR